MTCHFGDALTQLSCHQYLAHVKDMQALSLAHLPTLNYVPPNQKLVIFQLDVLNNLINNNTYYKCLITLFLYLFS